MKTYKILLDCPPCLPRPGDLIEGVVAGLPLSNMVNTHRVFGEWGFRFDMPEAASAELIDRVVESRVGKLYRKHVIRYGAWGLVTDPAEQAGEKAGQDA